MIIRSSITEDEFDLISALVEYEFISFSFTDAYKIAKQIHGYTSSNKEDYYPLWKRKLNNLNNKLYHVQNKVELTDDDIKIILCSLLGSMYDLLCKTKILKNANKDDLDWITFERTLIQHLSALNPQFKKFEKLLK